MSHRRPSGQDSVGHCGPWSPQKGWSAEPNTLHHTENEHPRPMFARAREVSGYGTSLSVQDSARTRLKIYSPDVAFNPAPHPILRSLTVSGLRVSYRRLSPPPAPQRQISSAFPVRYCDMLAPIGHPTVGPPRAALYLEVIRIQYVQLQACRDITITVCLIHCTRPRASTVSSSPLMSVSSTSMG